MSKQPIRLLVLGNHPLVGDWLDYYTGAIKERIEVAGHIGAERWAKSHGHLVVDMEQRDLTDMEFNRVLMGWASHAVLFGSELQNMAEGFSVNYKIVK